MMAVKKKRWWQNIYFELYLNIPFLCIQTRLLKEAIERLTYDICRLRVEVTRPHIWKMSRKTYSFEFDVYRREL